MRGRWRITPHYPLLSHASDLQIGRYSNAYKLVDILVPDITVSVLDVLAHHQYTVTGLESKIGLTLLSQMGS